MLVVKVFDSQKKKTIPNVNVKVFRIEKEPISPQQWVENLRNGSPFKSLILSTNTNEDGSITAELLNDTYEIKVEGFDLNQTCELTQNVEVLFVEPKKRWWSS